MNITRLMVTHAFSYLSCLWMFFSALAGVGYVDPETLVPTSGDAAFMPGAPVFDPVQAQEMALAKKVEEQRELERSWEKKKRPREASSHLEGL